MYLPIFILFQLTLFVYANPFHKYPFVFLLDIGNEELDKTNTEQIRVSVPGGSLALRYPAIGDGGDTIAHVRVSGIDFGTDLKANIIDGGPGYKYVILVFVGNPGVAYDAVITIQTVPDDEDKEQKPQHEEENLQENKKKSNGRISYQAEDKPINKNIVVNKAKPQNQELTQESSSFVSNEVDADLDINDSETQSNGQRFPNADVNEDRLVNDYLEDTNVSQESFSEDEQNEEDSVQAAPLRSIDDSYDGEQEQEIVEVDPNLYKQYESLKPHLSGNKVPEQSADVKAAVNKDLDEDPEDRVELDQLFNDEEIHNDSGKDENNNTYDRDDSNAVEY